MKSNLVFVSVIMPVFNGEEFLKDAINSILCQTHTHFELLIFNDYSTDNTMDILNQITDSRISIFQNNGEKGYIDLLNKGIEEARGKYIIRMDADDISLSNRFEKQIEFMEEHPEVGLSGCWANYFGNSNHIHNPPSEHAQLVISHLEWPVILHPSFIIRKSIVELFKLKYRKKYELAEDYKFLIEIGIVSKLGIIPDFLLKYRVHDSSVTSTKWQIQLGHIYAIRKEQYEMVLGRKLNNLELGFVENRKELNSSNLPNGINLIKEMISKNLRFDTKNLKEFLYYKLAGNLKRVNLLLYLSLLFKIIILEPSILTSQRTKYKLLKLLTFGEFRNKY